MNKLLLPTSLVGSDAQPDWLDRQKLADRFPPRIRARELWRVAPEFIEEAQDDATTIAIRDQERAGMVTFRHENSKPNERDYIKVRTLSEPGSPCCCMVLIAA